MIAFALANWKWLLIAGLVAYGGWQHMEVLSLEKAAIESQLAAEKAVNEAKAADAIKTKQLEDAYAAEVKRLQENANAQQVSIASAEKSDSCLHTPAARAFLGGLRSPDKAGAGQPRPAAGSDGRLPR